VRGAAIVSAPQVAECRVKHVEALHMQDQLGLLVLVLHDGTVKQQLVTLPEDTIQEDLSMASHRIGALFAGKSRREILAAPVADPLPVVDEFVQASVLELMMQIDAREAIVDGVVDLLDQPEFARRERARAIVEVLERPQSLRELFPEVPIAAGVQILIGTENRWDWMRDCAVVLTRYGEAGALTGVVGVVGPLRMPYNVAVPAVRYVSNIMTELLGDLGRVTGEGSNDR